MAAAAVDARRVANVAKEFIMQTRTKGHQHCGGHPPGTRSTELASSVMDENLINLAIPTDDGGWLVA